MVNKEAFAKRLQELMNYYEISAASLADKISVQRSSISHLLSGRNNPSLDFVLKILDNYPQISFEWFVKGIGSLEIETFSKEEISSTPTLFEQDIKKKAILEAGKKKYFSKDKPNITDKAIEKILLLYTDGSFEIYKD